MITIVDYGLGNLASIRNMIKKIGGESVITSSLEQIELADKLILPGVGHFAKGMENLDKRCMIPVLNKRVLENKVPILGICLGMQLLTSHSEEGDVNGLNWIEANTIKFDFVNKDFKIPHMGWNDVYYKQNNQLTNGLSPDPRYYFVHSYFVKCHSENNVLATCHYGFDFHCGIIKENISGVQFHPEKSHKYGMQLLGNFIKSK